MQADAARAGSQPARVGDKLDAAGMRVHALQQRDEAQVSQRELEDAVAFSTVQLHLYQDMQVRRQVEPDTDALMAQAGPGIGRRLVNAVQACWRGMRDVIMLLAALWLAVAVIAGIVWHARGRVKRRDMPAATAHAERPRARAPPDA